MPKNVKTWEYCWFNTNYIYVEVCFISLSKEELLSHFFLVLFLFVFRSRATYPSFPMVDAKDIIG